MPFDPVSALWPPVTPTAALGIAALVLILYVARRPAHDLILAGSRSLHALLRLGAHALARAELRLVQRNREVLLRIAADLRERAIEREFDRVNRLVKRDLSGYPALHRQLSEQIGRIDNDYQQSAEVPPMPPAWLEAIDAVASVRANGDPAVARILEDMHGTLESSAHQALLEYRAASRRRHRGLRRMLPYWRRLGSTLDNVERTVSGLDQRSQSIDTQMDTYRQIRHGDDHTARALAVSSFTQFFTASFILLLGALAALFNYQLLLPGLASVVAGGIGPVATAEIAAAFITLLLVGLGLVILECLRVTRLLPLLGGLDELARTRVLTAAVSVLLILTVLEASLAFSTPQHVMVGLGIGSDAAPQWLAGLVLLLLGTVLPVILALVAIPLEAFANSGRTVGASTLAALLRLGAAALRLTGSLSRLTGQLLIRGYDLAIFLPLWLERLLRRRPSAGSATSRTATASPAAPTASDAEPTPGADVPSASDAKPPAPRRSPPRPKAAPATAEES